jgi:hypothetical protein
VRVELAVEVQDVGRRDLLVHQSVETQVPPVRHRRSPALRGPRASPDLRGKGGPRGNPGQPGKDLSEPLYQAIARIEGLEAKVNG